VTRILALIAVTAFATAAPPAAAQTPEYLRWNASEAQKIGREFRSDGRVGGALDFRVVNTDRSYNYKLRATWLTTEVIQATARLSQIAERLTDSQTEALVREAEAALKVGTAVLVEIDPREGSGVIPREWLSLLGPRGVKDGEAEGVRGEITPALSKIRALSGVMRRDYAYDVFWVTFPLTTQAGTALFPDGVQEAELVVRIYNKEGRVRWTIPASVRNPSR
jgi:hypothetical protein